MKTTTVYGIRVPGGPVRYIGQTTYPLDKRLRHHNYLARRGGQLPLHWWLRKHQDAEIFVIKADAIWNVDEIICIRLGRIAGLELLNRTDGGDGLADPSPEARRKMGAPMKGKKHSPETIAKMRAAALGKPKSDETRARMSKPKSAEHAQNISRGMRRRHGRA